MMELDVAPLRQVRIAWAEVAKRLSHELPARSSGLLPEVPVLRLIEDQSVVDPRADLAPDLVGWVDPGYPSSVGLSFFWSEPKYLDEDLWLEDYGRNIDPEEQKRIASAWRSVGSYFYLSSNAGRAEGDLDLIAALAVTLAALTDGVVITYDDRDLLGTGVGAFTASQFKVAVWGTDDAGM